jgi:hypothetical protein
MRFKICCIFKPGFSVILVMTGKEMEIFLKTERGLTIKLSKNVLRFMYFYLISYV